MAGFQWQRVLQGLSRPMLYPINKPTAPPADPAVSCILCCGLSRPANANAAETTNSKRADVTTASSDFFPGFHGCPRPLAPSLPLARGFSPGGLVSSSSCSMRLISFSGGVGFISEGWRRQSSMAAPQACRCQTTKLWLSVQQYYVRANVR